MGDENEDVIVKEIDVYLSKSLANSVYVLQYPVRPIDKPFTNSKYLGAKIKPKQNKLEIEIELNTTNENYSRPKGEQFALNVDGKPCLLQAAANSKQPKEQKYYKSNCMDKQVLASSNATLGQMSRLYQLGILKDDKLHLNPIHSILQMKPSFEYFDIYEKKIKETKEAQHAEMDYSTEEEADIDDKAELVTLKYSSQNASSITAQQESEQNWIPLSYLNLEDSNSTKMREMLYCKNLDNNLKIDCSQEEFINRLIDNNQSIKSEPKTA